MEIQTLKTENMKKLSKADTNEKWSRGLSKMLIKKCLSGSGNLCPSQVISTATFKFQQKKKIFQKSECVFYLIECTLYKKQYIGKAETDFDIRLNKHRKGIKGPDEILATKHF